MNNLKDCIRYIIKIIDFMTKYDTKNVYFKTFGDVTYTKSESTHTSNLSYLNELYFYSLVEVDNDDNPLDPNELHAYRILIRNNRELILCSPKGKFLDELGVLDRNDVKDTVRIPKSETFEEDIFQISTVHDELVIDTLELYDSIKEYIPKDRYLTIELERVCNVEVLKEICRSLPKL